MSGVRVKDEQKRLDDIRQEAEWILGAVEYLAANGDTLQAHSWHNIGGGARRIERRAVRSYREIEGRE